MNKTQDKHKPILIWLKICLSLIFAMILLGGATRLTGSGLSMVDWHPSGFLPPLNLEQWLAEFQRYQQFPEFQLINQQMQLDGFKSIFWFEYSHRMLGRFIGLVFILPLIVFYCLRKIPAGYLPRFITLIFLGGLQGLLGWYMVKSGLVNNPHVSQYRLAAHLMAAVLIFGFICWTILDLTNTKPYLDIKDSIVPRWRKLSLGLLALLLVTLLSGAFVAGLKAGLIYNSFPLMGGKLIPPGLAALSPWYLNLFENLVTVQFNHRLLTMLSALLLLLWYFKGRSLFEGTSTNTSFKLIAMVVIIQVALGILTLLMQVPLVLGVLHQA